MTALERMEKKALIERLVRHAMTDVPGTEKLRLLMRHRSPAELAGIQHGVTNTFKKVEEPVKRVVHGVLDRIPHAGVKKVLKGGADLLIENPETIPMQAVPIPGLTPAYMLAKKGLEKGLDYIAPIHKAAGQKAAGAWLNHAALNLGQAARDVRYFADHPNADRLAEKGSARHVAASVTSRAPSLASNLYYAALPPQLHHTAEELSEDKSKSLKQLFLEGYAPWEHRKEKKAKLAFKLQGETKHQGLDIAIENRKGSVRSGTTDDGKKWRTVMKLPYGYIRDTKGADGEDIDCYVGPNKNAPNAYVVHQRKPDGTGYDEDKIMLGMGSRAEARKAYLAHYDDPKFLGPMKTVPMERLKALLDSKKKLVKISGVTQAALFEELVNIAAGSAL